VSGSIRLGRPNDLPILREIERASGERFREFGLDHVADDEPAFDHIPWNRPLYEHLGFRVLSDQEIGPRLRSMRDAESAHGLDPATRVVMRSDLSAPSDVVD
jgi:hypothetical protein